MRYKRRKEAHCGILSILLGLTERSDAPTNRTTASARFSLGAQAEEGLQGERSRERPWSASNAAAYPKHLNAPWNGGIEALAANAGGCGPRTNPAGCPDAGQLTGAMQMDTASRTSRNGRIDRIDREDAASGHRGRGCRICLSLPAASGQDLE